MFLDKKIFLLELTIPFETNLEAAHSRKSEKYASPFSDLSSFSLYRPELFTIEVGSRGFVSKSNLDTLVSLLPAKSSVHPKRLRSYLYRLATLWSYSIFRSRSDPSWISPPLLVMASSSWSVFLLQDPLGDASPSFFSIPLFPLLVGYPFFRIFVFSPIFIIVQHAWRLTRGRICTQ